MTAYASDFRVGVISPTACIGEGWRLVKDKYWLFFGISAVGILLGSVVPLYLLLGPMLCGIHLCLLRQMRGEMVTFDGLFKGFDYFMPSLAATALQVLPMLIVVFGGYVGFLVVLIGMSASANARGGGGEAAVPILVGMGILFGIGFLIASLIGILFVFSYHLIVDRKMAGLDACRLSARAVMGNFGGVLGLAILLSIMGVAGVLLCYVGALLVLPISFAALAVAYRSVFPDLGPAPPFPGYGTPYGYAPRPEYGAPYGYPPQQ